MRSPSMSYCLNPDCQKPQNLKNNRFCQNCGTELLLKSRYRALKLIGQGGFGKTFLGIDEDIPSQPVCVIKQFLPIALSTLEINKATELFAQEAQQLDQLGNHNQIPQLLAHVEQNERLYLIQEYIDGQNLAQELEKEGPFSEEAILELLKSLLPVLDFVHSYQVIHRDIKPENIIRRTQDGQFVLVDFGASKLANSNVLAKTGTIIGTPGYTAPEQAMGKANFSSDIYSLGVTCIHLLLQIEPLELFDHSENDWVWQDYLTTSLSSELVDILKKMVAMATKKRYRSAQEVLESLNLLNNQPPPNLPKTLPRLVEIDKRFGYIDNEGKMVISLQFSQARGFSPDGLAAVKRGRHWGFIDFQGKLRIAPQFEAVSDFAGGLAAFKYSKWYWLQAKWGYLNYQGKIVIEPQFNQAFSFSEGLALVRVGFLWGYINTEGVMMIEPQFEEAGNFKSGFARVKFNTKWGYINPQGKVVIPPRDNARDFSEDLAAVEINQFWGYIDKLGKLVIQPQYLDALDFSEGLAPILMETKFLGLLVTGQKWGYINKLGTVAIEPQFDWADSFAEGLAAVKKNNYWGYINKLGQMVIAPRFDFAAAFTDNIAEVILAGQCRYINKRGEFIY